VAHSWSYEHLEAQRIVIWDLTGLKGVLTTNPGDLVVLLLTNFSCIRLAKPRSCQRKGKREPGDGPEEGKQNGPTRLVLEGVDIADGEGLTGRPAREPDGCGNPPVSEHLQFVGQIASRGRVPRLVSESPRPTGDPDAWCNSSG
jgi:hypothetical protein